MIQDSTSRLIAVAEGLKALLPDVVFVGGAVTAIYATNPAAPIPRPSMDVDCVVEISSRRQYAGLEQTLEELGFKHDTSPGAPICRWLFQSTPVDIMPTDPHILGFANVWSARGVGSAIEHEIRPNTIIRILPAAFFLASKLEALESRGQDLRLSGDLEDIIYVIDNRREIVQEILRFPRDLLLFVRENVSTLLQKEDLHEAIEAVLGFGSDRKRAASILKVFERLSHLDDETFGPI